MQSSYDRNFDRRQLPTGQYIHSVHTYPHAHPAGREINKETPHFAKKKNHFEIPNPS